MRRAFFWSLAAHVFVLWLMLGTDIREADSVGSGLAVTLSPRPVTPGTAPIKPNKSVSTLQPIAPKLLLGKDTAALPVPPVAPTENALPPLPITNTSASSIPPAIQSVTVLDADGLRRYRFALAREMRRTWAYPAQALTQKLEGTTEIRIELLAGGRFASARIENSSGHTLLDDAALKIISNAAASATVPSSLLGEAISIVQPVVFSVRAESKAQDH